LDYSKMGVFHEFWGRWCMFTLQMVQDGLVHGRWSMMDLHGGDNLLNDCLTLVRCWLGILLLGVGVLLTDWWTPCICGHMESLLAWRTPYLEGGAL